MIPIELYSIFHPTEILYFNVVIFFSILLLAFAFIV